MHGTEQFRPILPHPPAPGSLEESGLSLDLVLQLTLKTLYFAGDLTGTDLAKRLGVRFPVIEPALEFLKAQHQCEITGGAMLGAAAYRYRITDAGRKSAALYLESSHYVGFAPVPLAHYQRYMREYAQVAPGHATRERVRDAFSHLVISDRVLDQLGPAINAGHSMFVYGPPGNGKTVISQAIRNLLDGDIAIPHAIEVEGGIIRLFDPVQHEPLPVEEAADSMDAGIGLDMRWVRCRRPLVMVGGELRLDALELTYDAVSGIYRAPVQTVANGGVLVIDDFGRQQCEPRQLLNRWIVPLESRVDYLTMKSGHKFELPFVMLMVFATNIKPAELVDEAFLRRIHYKVFAESPTVEDFVKIFHRCCDDRGIDFDRTVVEGLLADYYRPRQVPLRGCHPRDLVEQALSLAKYLGLPARLDRELLRRACESYFVDDRETAVSLA
ncbi:MAG: ATP-binding protein [Acidobacteria bacterium]|nr:ATP-binding protein [Acidobacteriota bacterium]